MRTSLTMLGIIIGISSVILISSIGQGAVAFITEELSTFGTNFFSINPGEDPLTALAGTSKPITIGDAEALEESDISNIEYIVPFGWSSSEVSGNEEKIKSLIYGMPSHSETMLKPEMIYGEFISEIDDDNQNRVAVLGIDVADELFGENTNPVGESIRIDDTRFKVIGVSKSKGALTARFFDTVVNIPLSTMTTYITGNDEIIEIDISVVNENLIDQTIEDVEIFLRDHRGIEGEEKSDFFMQSFKDALSTIQTVTNLLTLAIAAISGISLIVGGVGVMNIMLVTVTERTKEIGLLKAIGAKDRDILIQFLIEAITLSLIGGIIGIILGLSGAFAISQFAGIPFVISPLVVILAVGMSSLVGIIFGLYPANKAAKLNPIDALRYE
ncbi:MAG: ABC transporter permease [Candidatus Pacebacteria bacterium]|nr:ABC transporter permease [Candidatus Paceibacterota bacterium]